MPNGGSASDKHKSRKHQLFSENDKLRVANSGDPIPLPHRQSLESRFGTDLSHVRIHTGPNAERMTRILGAEAFTLDNRIFFAPGKFDPGRNKGLDLLTHELAHMIQQNAMPNKK